MMRLGEYILNKKWPIAIPILLLAASLLYVAYITFTGNLNLDIDFKGGTQIMLESGIRPDAAALENLIKPLGGVVRVSGSGNSYTLIIDVPSEVSADTVTGLLESNGYKYALTSVQSVGPSLSGSFLDQAKIVLLVAFLFMAITIFIIFKKPMPSFYIVLAGFADIIETFAISQLLGIKLSLATFTALLLLTGFSVDTNVLLTSRVLKRHEGTINERMIMAAKTGLTMIGTAAAAVATLFLISGSATISQIASTLLIGLIIDIPNTWILNAHLLKWYLERKVV
ncbi:MAG TPA: protein translocase subunit SecF [archaeon]|nr:protein translocase subunit SecF [archaeon]